MQRRAATADRRQAILDAALPLFVERGVRSTSIEDICAASGASNGSVYHHFASKEGIAATLYAHAIGDYQRGALGVLRAAESAEAGVRGLVEQFLRWVGAHRDLADIMIAVEHGDVRKLAADQVAALNDVFLPEVRGWVERHQATGRLPPMAPDLMTPAVLGPARRFAELWLRGRTITPIEDAARALSELVWNGLGGGAHDMG